MEKLGGEKCGLTGLSFANTKDDDLLQIQKMMQIQEMTGLGFANSKDHALLFYKGITEFIIRYVFYLFICSMFPRLSA